MWIAEVDKAIVSFPSYNSASGAVISADAPGKHLLSFQVSAPHSVGESPKCGVCNLRHNLFDKALGRLAWVGWLAALSPAFKYWVAIVGIEKTDAAGALLFRAGNAPDGLYGLKSVSIEVEFPLVAKDPVSFLRAKEWFWIGDAAVLRDAPRIVSVRAGAESTVLYLSGEDTKKVLQDQPEQWLAFHDPATRNAAQAVALLAEALALTVRARVCRLLAPSEDSKEVRITQDDLAKTLSIARPTLGRCLKDLEERRAVKIKYRNLLILDRQVFPHFQDEQ